MKIYIVDEDRALWEDEYNELVEQTMTERQLQVSDKLAAIEEMIQWIEDYAKRVYDPSITYYRFEIEPEKSALINQLWKYASEYANTLIKIENYGGSTGARTSPCAVVRCYNKDADALSQLGPILRFAVPELKRNLSTFYSRSVVERDINAQILELSDR